jgi:hypothetical protein
MSTPILSRASLIGLAKEATQGTYVAPTVYVPAMTPKPEDVVGYEDDTSIQASAAKLQGVYQTTKDTTYGLDFNAYFEVIGNFFVALGMLDTVSVGRSVSDAVTNATTTVTSATAAFVANDAGATVSGTNIPAGATIVSVTNSTTIVISAAATGSGAGGSLVIAGGAGSYNHKFRLTAAQPPSYSITDYDGYETLGYPGMMEDQLDLTIDAKTMVKAATQWKGWPAASQSQPTPSWPALPPGLGWEASYTIGGVAVTRIVSMGLTAKRSAEPIHTSQGLQTPFNVFAAELEASMKIKGLRLDDTERNHVLNNDQPTFVASITSPSGSPAPVLTITATKSAWKKAPTDRSGKYMQGDYTVDLVTNTTDSGPFQVRLANGVSTAY